MERKAYLEAWRAAHPEKMKEYRRIYRAAHPEKIKAYRKAIGEKIRARTRAWRAANPKKVAEQNSKRIFILGIYCGYMNNKPARKDDNGETN